MNRTFKDDKGQAIKRCGERFEEGYNCSETVLLAFSEQLGIKNGAIPRLATPFGGGIYKRKFMCGALSGAIMAVGLKNGRNTAEGDREVSYSGAERIIEKFIEKYGSVNCIDLLGYGSDGLDRIEQDKQRIRTDICGPIIKQIAEWLWEELQ